MSKYLIVAAVLWSIAISLFLAGRWWQNSTVEQGANIGAGMLQLLAYATAALATVIGVAALVRRRRDTVGIAERRPPVT
jgi:hypothetical protein